MHTRHCLKIAHRMHLLLQREIGRGLDLQRMLRDARYSRDVLLVCDAMHRTELPDLAAFYRRAAAGPGETEIAAAMRVRGNGLGALRLLFSLFWPQAGTGTTAPPMPVPLRLGARSLSLH